MRAQRIIPPLTAFHNSHGKIKRPRNTDEQHLKWIRNLPCIISGRRDGIEAAHIRFGAAVYGKRDVGLSEKPDDRWALPLHRDLHRDQHAHGDERDWWTKQGIDPLPICLALYHVTGDDELGETILRAARERRQAATECEER